MLLLCNGYMYLQKWLHVLLHERWSLDLLSRVIWIGLQIWLQTCNFAMAMVMDGYTCAQSFVMHPTIVLL